MNPLRSKFHIFSLRAVLPAAVAATLILIDPTFAQIHVDQNASGNVQNGTSWPTAFLAVQDGINAAAGAGAGEVWVAMGAYSEAISMAGGLSLYGGFLGTETNLSDRDFELNPTIIDASEADAGGPAEHVVVMVGISNARLDGFTITGALGLRSMGGGIFCDSLGDGVTIANCTIAGNMAQFGGGVACVGSSSPAIEDCNIVQNIGLFGAGLYCDSSSPAVSRSRISGNQDGFFNIRDAVALGGGVYLARSLASLTNCVISNNRVSAGGFFEVGNQGGGVYCNQSFPTIVNCTLSMNQASFGGAISASRGSSPTIVNSIFSRNDGVAIFEEDASSDVITSNSLLFDNIGGDYFDEGETTYTGAEAINANVAEANANVDGFPIFVDARNGDYHLRDGSAALDRGSIAEAPATDFDGAPRPGSDGLVDIGAFEAEGSFIPLPPFPPSGARHWLKYP